MQAIERLEAITIARVHGHAIGGGVVLPLACDLRVAARGTVFQVPEVEEKAKPSPEQIEENKKKWGYEA